METHPQARKMQLLCLCLAIWLAAGATVSGKVEKPTTEETLHRSKRTMTTICVEIRPSGPQDEPYYMCRGANFGAENAQQGCVEVRNQGGGQEPVYMCQGMEPTKTVSGEENRPAPVNYQPVTQPGSIHTFPSFPAFGGGSNYPQPQIAENPLYQFPPPPPPPSPPTPYPEQSSHPQPLPQQPQNLGQNGFYGHPMAAHSASPAAHSPGMPSVPYPTAGSAPAAPSGVPDGPGPAAKAPSYDPAAGQGSSHPPARDHGIVGSSRHRSGFDGDMLAAPEVGFMPEELNQQYRRPVNQPQDQLMWVPISHSADPENDPVMRAFYSSLAGSGSQSQEASVPPEMAPVVPMVGQGGPGYAPYNGQYPELSPPPTPAYSPAEMYPSPPPTTPYCNGCMGPSAPAPCPTPDNGMSYSNACPSFQPVIITMPTMPCYGQQQPTPYYSAPRAAPGILQRPSPPLGAPFGLAPAPVGNPFGGSFGIGAQMGSPFGMSQGYGMDQQVGSPFGMGMQLGMGLSPFGPFGTLNPFNPFNRILGASAPTTPAPHNNFFQRVFNFNPNELPLSTSTTEASPVVETSTTERSGKLNFASSTPTPSTSENPASATLGAAHHYSDEEEDSVEEVDADDQPATTLLPSEDLDKSQPEITASQFVSKAADLLKPDKRKRHNSRSSSRVPQKHRYLQQL